MKQQEFIWLTKQYFKDAKLLQLDDESVIAKIKGNIKFVYENPNSIKIRFTEFNENYIIPNKSTLRLIYEIFKKENSESTLYEFCQNNIKKETN